MSFISIFTSSFLKADIFFLTDTISSVFFRSRSLIDSSVILLILFLSTAFLAIFLEMITVTLKPASDFANLIAKFSFCIFLYFLFDVFLGAKLRRFFAGNIATRS